MTATRTHTLTDLAAYLLAPVTDAFQASDFEPLPVAVLPSSTTMTS